jgi:cytochrome P450 family 6
MTVAWPCILFSAIAFILGSFYVYLNVKFSYWKKRGIPCLEPKFPLGNLADILTRRKNMGEAYADVYRKMEGMNFGGVFLMHHPQLIIRSPEMVKKCLLADFKYFHDHGFVYDEKIDPLTGNLFMLSGEKWKNLREVLSPTFSTGRMKNMFTTLVKCGKELAEFVEEPVKRGDVVEIHDIVARFTTDAIASCAFGIQCNCLKYPEAEFRKWGKRMVELSLVENIIGVLYTLVPSVPIALKLPLTPWTVSTFFRKVVKETVEFREENEEKRNDFLQLLIDLKEGKGK